MKKKEQGREKNQQEIQVVKVKAIHDKIAESGAWDNKIGMLMEIGLIATLTAFCMICFLTGMDIPVKKMGLSVEIIVLSILFWFTFQTNKGSGYIFSGELILYGICGFWFRNEISQGLAAIINIINEKIMDYYNINVPLFQTTNHAEQHMQVFCMFVVVIIAGVTAYVVVNKSTRIFLCLIQFPIAMGSLMVGFLPECFYFLGFILAVAVLMAMPKQQILYVNKKNILQSMMVRNTILVIGCFLFFFGFLMIGIPAKRYETINTTEYKDKLQEKIQESFLGKISGFGNENSVGGLSHGQLGRTGKLNYTGRKCLEIDITGEIQLPLYLKSYVGERYANDHWENFSEEIQETERKALGQMRNGEEQGAAWMELFSDMSDWFLEEAFAQYAEVDTSQDVSVNEGKVLYGDSYVTYDTSYGAGSTSEEYSSLSSSIYVPQTWDVESEEETLNYDNEYVIGSYSYGNIQAVLAQKQTTIHVKNIGMSDTEEFVPYGRILSKDKKERHAASYTGYPNLSLYVKGGMEEYGYANGNFIERLLECSRQSQYFLDECIAHIPAKDREKILDKKITIDELCDIVNKYNEKMYFGEEGLEEGEEMPEDAVLIKKKHGYYMMENIYGTEYAFYLKGELILQNVEEYLDKILKYINESLDYERYVETCREAGTDTSKLSKICEEFKAGFAYIASGENIDEDTRLAYIGRSINFVTAFLTENMEYSLEPGKLPEGKNFVDYYLFEQKKGYCSHFATIAVNMFRELGIPSRYVEGFVVKKEDVPQNKISQTIELKDKSAHAWAEIYVKGYGWVPVEVTPGYENGIEAGDFESLLKNLASNNSSKNGEGENIIPTPAGNASKHQTTESKQHKKNLILNEKTIQWIKITIVVILICGMVILVIWLRYAYVWKKRIREHSCKRENERVCNYYAQMERLLRGVHAIEDADTFRMVLNTYIQTEEITQKKALFYITETADKETWTEFADIINIAAYSSHDVTGHQLETVRLLSEKMRKEVFSSMPKVKIWYYQYICLL